MNSERLCRFEATEVVADLSTIVDTPRAYSPGNTQIARLILGALAVQRGIAITVFTVNGESSLPASQPAMGHFRVWIRMAPSSV